jgi:WD40 repeat protein
MEGDFHCTHIYRGHEGLVTAIQINPNDTSQMASASSDGTIKLWNLLDEAQAIRTLPELDGMISSIDFLDTTGSCMDDPKQDLLASTSQNRVVKVWNYRTGSLLWSSDRVEDYIRSVRFHPARQVIMAVLHNGTIMAWSYDISDCYGIINTTSIYKWDSDDDDNDDEEEEGKNKCMVSIDEALAVSYQWQTSSISGSLAIGTNTGCACVSISFSTATSDSPSKFSFQDVQKYTL